MHSVGRVSPDPNLAISEHPDAGASSAYNAPANPDTFGGEEYRQVAQQMLTCHYSVNNGFFGDGGLLRDIDRVRGIPIIAVAGRHDMVCPVKTAYDLHKHWPEMELQVVPDAGHSMYDRRITHCLLAATDRMLSVSMQMN